MPKTNLKTNLTARTSSAAPPSGLPPDARLVAAALAARLGIASFGDLQRDAPVERLKVRPAVAALVRAGHVLVLLDHVVSLAPPVRLDHPAVPLWLRVLASAAFHGSLAAATRALAVPSGGGTFRAAGQLLRNGLLVSEGEVLSVPEGPEAEALRRLFVAR